MLEFMANNREVVIVSGVRTAIGGYGGTLKDKTPAELGAAVLREAVKRAKVEGKDIGQVVFANIIHTEGRDMYLGRVIAVEGGLPIETPGYTLNRLCGSGLESIINASNYILVGEIDAAVAGGSECMSRAAYWLPTMRWGQRMNDGQVIDAMVKALTDPFDGCHMGITAENVAEKWGVSRADQDALAVESHRRAAAATEKGYFKEQILPIEIPSRKGTIIFEKDEHIRADASIEGMAKLKPVFKKDGTVTAGNASGVNDAAAAVVLMERSVAERKGLKPLARLVAYSHAAVEPKYMGIGPVPAIRKLFEKTGLTAKDMDVMEINEAFASQALAVVRDLNLPADKVNPNGSGISLGHPVGATGSILTIKTIYELHRTGGRYGLASMCIGGGQGIAAMFERL
jgi:acetyl-CoA C-acetyltransferase